MSLNNKPHSGEIVLVGGGFGGLTTAIALSRTKNRPPIILIEPKDNFVFTPLLYELLSGEVRSWEIAPTYKKFLGNKGVVMIQSFAKCINTDKQIVTTSCGLNINYSQLVIGTGSRPNDFGIPGVSEHALMFQTLMDVHVLKKLIKKIKIEKKPKPIVIVGAGPTGIELACKLFDLLGSHTDIKLIELKERVLPNGKSFNQDQCERSLKERGIEIYLQTKVLSITSSHVKLFTDKNQIDKTFELTHGGVIWTAGAKAVVPEIFPPIPLKNGMISVDSSLNVMNLKNVFALGDLALNEQIPYPLTAQVAMQQGELTAKNLMALRIGEEMKPFEYQDNGEMLSLGIGQATITGFGLTIAGSMAFQIRRMAYLTKMPNWTTGLRATFAWVLNNFKQCK